MALIFSAAGLQFFAPHIGRAMDDLSLKISEIHYIEIHYPTRGPNSNARSRYRASGDASNPPAPIHNTFAALQLELTLHANLRHDQVPRITQYFLVRKRYGLNNRLCKGGHI